MNWTQDEAIEFECAREIITSLIAIQTRQIAEERELERPDEERLAQLRAYRSKLADERTNLHVDEHEKIAKAIEEYGALIRAWRKQHKIAVS